MLKKLSGILLLLLSFTAHSAFAQQKTVSGTVSDQNGLPLPGVNIIVEGTSNGTQSDFDGNYSIKANEGQTLLFTYIGQKDIRKTVGSTSTINVQMEEDAQALEEVVVIAYGAQNRKKLVQSVSTVGTDDIADIPAVSPQELLQGQASGVQVVNSSGILGAAPVIKIRGVASISSGGRPLIVVDGVPMNDNVQTTGQGGQGLNPLADINPNDIASFSVLKDAAATAVYGSRGANGVILITTKSGKLNQDSVVTLDVSTSISESTDLLEMLNGDEYRQFLVNRGSAASVEDLPQGNFDWPSNVVRTGYSQNINLGVSGGNDKSTYYVGLTYQDQEGFIKGNNLSRLSGRLNLSHQANNWLKVGMNIGIGEVKNDRVGSENSTFAPLTSSYLQRPYVEPRDENGNYVNTGFIANVLEIEDSNINDANSFRTFGNIFGEISLTDNLSFRSDFGIDRVSLEEFERRFELNTPGGYARNRVNAQNKYVFTNTLNYKKDFGLNHSLNAVAGMSYEQTDVRRLTVDATEFLSDQQINTISGATPGTTNNTVTGSRLVGYFARANYSYADKYIVEGSLRRDGSSRFGAGNQYGTFWAAGAAWLLSEEGFMQDVNWINSLKLRGNYGTSGNDRIGDFASLERFEGGNISNYNGASGLRQLSAPNPNLQWERSESFDVGFEALMFNNVVRLNVDYYKKKTSDLILNVPIPQSNGGLNSIIDNVGEMENRGFDIDLSVNIFNKENFQWTSSLNVGINENEVLSLPGANVDAQGREFVAGSTVQRAVVGNSVNTFYLIRYKGVNPETGDAEWLDIDGNPTTTPTSADRVIAGDANPDFVGGFRNNFKYKNWDLSAFFNFSYGNDIYVSGLRFTDNPAGGFNVSKRILDVWENPGDNAYVPSYSSSTFRTFRQHSTLFMKDGSYLRLKNVTLGYTVPKNLTEKLGFVKGIRFYATANNLFTIKEDGLDGIDPEVTDSVSNGVQGETFFTPPQSKTYLLGARLTF